MKKLFAVGLVGLPLLAIVLRNVASHPVQATQSSPASLNSEPASQAPHTIPVASHTARPIQNSESIVSSLTAVEAETDSDSRSEALDHIAESVSDADLRAVLHLLVPLEGAGASEVRQRLVRRWAEADSPAAAAWVAQLPEGPARHDALQQVAIAWANTDLPAAVSWVRELPEGGSKQSALLNTAYEAARTEPLTALDLARTLPPARDRDELVVHALSQWATADFPAASDWASQVTDADLRKHLLAAVAVASADHDPRTSATLIANALTAGDTQDRAVVSIVQRWAQHSPRDAALWVSQFPDNALRDSAAQNLVTIWTAQDASGAGNWLNELPAGTLRTVGTAAYAQTLAQRNETQAP